MPYQPQNVNILISKVATEEQPQSTIVLESIRTGFPTWPITIWDNVVAVNSGLAERAKEIGATYRHISQMNCLCATHWAWLRWLIDENPATRFTVVDSDVIFFESMEFKLSRHANLIGEYIPTFLDPITKMVHIERLHPAVMSIDPQAILDTERKLNGDKPNSVSLVDLVTPVHVTFRGTNTYYDTLANAYHAVGNRMPLNYEGEIIQEFVHLHCGSWIQHVKAINPLFYAGLIKKQYEVIKDPAGKSAEYRAELIKFYQQQGANSNQ